MEQKDYRLAAIMYTDIAGFSRMMEKDEAATLDLLTYHNNLISEIVGRHHGTVIKTIGDALLVDFKNTVEALQSALEIQDKLYAHNRENPGLPLLIRIGVHLGDIYFFENDALGEGINIAARLQSLARPGGICFSQDVYNLVLNKIEFRAEKLGKVSLKNITKEIHAYEITSANVEFDPDRDKPRPGFKTGSYLNEEELPVGGFAASSGPLSSRRPALAGGPAEASPASASQASTPRPEAVPPPQAGASPAPAGQDAMAGPGPDRDYSEQGSKSVLEEIRRSILQDTKTAGRRLSVDEALDRYGYYGVEAQEVIASMAEQGLLVREQRGRPGFGPGSPPGVGRFGPGGQGFDPEALGRNIAGAVQGFVGEMQRSFGPGAPGGGGRQYFDGEEFKRRMERRMERYKRHAERNSYKYSAKAEPGGLETGKWDSKLMEDENWRPGQEELSGSFAEYRSRLELRSRRQRGGLVGNLMSYLAVNGVLWYINLSSGGGFLWAAIVSAGWGIGLISSIAAAARGKRKLAEIDAMPDLDSEALANYKQLNRVEDSFAMHGASTLGVSILFATLQGVIFGPQASHDLWFLIPMAAMVFGFVSHAISYSVTRSRLRRRIMEPLGVSGSWAKVFRHGRARRAEAAGLGPYAALYREAEETGAAILAELRGDPMAGELAPSLEGYVSQVRLLAQSSNEIDRIVEAIPMADLGKDRAQLVAKESSSGSDSLRAEYRKSIEEIDKQERSYQELKEQSEVIRLRLGSSVNQLKQMRLDMARLKAGPGAEGAPAMEALKTRTDELARYLADLRRGYDESRRDPFAELEELERASAEAKRLEGPAREGEIHP